jgi:hypothetical protein
MGRPQGTLGGVTMGLLENLLLDNYPTSQKRPFGQSHDLLLSRERVFSHFGQRFEKECKWIVWRKIWFSWLWGVVGFSVFLYNDYRCLQ